MFQRRRRKVERTNYEIAHIIGDSLRGCCRPDDVSGFKDPIEERRFLERNLNQAGEGEVALQVRAGPAESTPQFIWTAEAAELLTPTG